MAETQNISKMAEMISEEIFSEFLWVRSGPANQNWPCENQDHHKNITHPTDVVLFYDEPYAARRTYLQTDLKSYARGSITASAIRSALKSLAKQVACAEVSSRWRELYAHENVNFDICGLLFVYNHDGEYDTDFGKIISEIKTLDVDLPSRSRLYVLGPDDIFWLDNVRVEIQRMRGSSGRYRIPDRRYCSYVYPQLARKANIRSDTTPIAATMEMITSPWIILRYRDPHIHIENQYMIFMRRPVDSIEEFMYLLDYLRHHELLKSAGGVFVRPLPLHADNAAVLLEKAKLQYLEEVLGETAHTPMADIVNSISILPISQAVTKFSDIVIGMEVK